MRTRLPCTMSWRWSVWLRRLHPVRGVQLGTAHGRRAGTIETPELASRHNLIYWRNDDYLGIGPGAHSHLRTEAAMASRWSGAGETENRCRPMGSGCVPATASRTLLRKLHRRLSMGETMMLGLRLVREGVPLDRFTALHGRSLNDAFGTEVDRLCGDGLLTVDAQRVRLTPRGLMIGNQVFARFLPDN